MFSSITRLFGGALTKGCERYSVSQETQTEPEIVEKPVKKIRIVKIEEEPVEKPIKKIRIVKIEEEPVEKPVKKIRIVKIEEEPVEKPVKKIRIVKIEEDTPKKRRIVKIENSLPSSYTKEEVATMDQFMVLSEFIRITGREKLPCAHCAKKETNVLSNWTHSIYVRAMKVGLSADMKLPKTCDKMQARNRACNPVNNPVYSIIRSNNYEIEVKAEAVRLRQELLQNICIETCPYRYIA